MTALKEDGLIPRSYHLFRDHARAAMFALMPELDAGLDAIVKLKPSRSHHCQAATAKFELTSHH
jgi:hypothetical protein